MRVFNFLNRGNHPFDGLREWFWLAIAVFLVHGAVPLQADSDPSSGDLLRWSEAAATSGSMAIEGQSGWLFLDRELRHLATGRFWGEEAAMVSAASNPAFADPLPAILDFYEQLSELGVRLVVVPVPAKASLYPIYLPESVSPEVARDWVQPQQEFLEMLRQAGVEVLDLQSIFEAREGRGARGSLYCQQDTHWSGEGVYVTAEKLLDFLPEDLREKVDPPPFVGAWEEQRIEGDLWMSLPETDRPEAERLSLHFVRDRGTGEVPAPDSTSPVVLMGDSHSLIFHAGGDMHARGAGLPEQLGLQMGFMPDVVAVRGSGATPARINLLRRSQRQPDYWENKAVVFWVFSVREFTQADGWRLVPISNP